LLRHHWSFVAGGVGVVAPGGGVFWGRGGGWFWGGGRGVGGGPGAVGGGRGGPLDAAARRREWWPRGRGGVWRARAHAAAPRGGRALEVGAGAGARAGGRAPRGELCRARAATDGPGGAAQRYLDEPAHEAEFGGHETHPPEGGRGRRL